MMAPEQSAVAQRCPSKSEQLSSWERDTQTRICDACIIDYCGRHFACAGRFAASLLSGLVAAIKRLLGTFWRNLLCSVPFILCRIPYSITPADHYRIRDRMTEVERMHLPPNFSAQVHYFCATCSHFADAFGSWIERGFVDRRIKLHAQHYLILLSILKL